MTDAITKLRDERYINLETFKKDGAGVKTPVWFAEVGGKLYVVTDGTSYKVKRIRRNSNAKVAACNASGKDIRSPWFDAKVEVVFPGAELEAAHRALRSKYGIQMKVLDFASRLGGRYERRAYLRISV